MGDGRAEGSSATGDRGQAALSLTHPGLEIKILYHCTLRLKMFYLILCLFFMYYLCEKYYKPITVQYYIADCVSWVPRLTLLGLRTYWT